MRNLAADDYEHILKRLKEIQKEENREGEQEEEQTKSFMGIEFSGFWAVP